MVRLAESIVWPWVSQTRAALMASSSVSYGPFILTYSPYVDTQILGCTSVLCISVDPTPVCPLRPVLPTLLPPPSRRPVRPKSGQGNPARRSGRDVRSLTWEVMGALGGTRTPNLQIRRSMPRVRPVGWHPHP